MLTFTHVVRVVVYVHLLTIHIHSWCEYTTVYVVTFLGLEN